MASLGAAHLGGTRHGGGPGAARNERRTDRHDARTGLLMARRYHG